MKPQVLTIYRSFDGGKTFHELEMPGFLYFGVTMGKDPKGNIYVVTATPESKGYFQISP